MGLMGRIGLHKNWLWRGARRGEVGRTPPLYAAAPAQIPGDQNGGRAGTQGKKPWRGIDRAAPLLRARGPVISYAAQAQQRARIVCRNEMVSDPRNASSRSGPSTNRGRTLHVSRAVPLLDAIEQLHRHPVVKELASHSQVRFSASSLRWLVA